MKLGKKGPICQNSSYTLHTLNFTQLSGSLSKETRSPNYTTVNNQQSQLTVSNKLTTSGRMMSAYI